MRCGVIFVSLTLLHQTYWNDKTFHPDSCIDYIVYTSTCNKWLNCISCVFRIKMDSGLGIFRRRFCFTAMAPESLERCKTNAWGISFYFLRIWLACICTPCHCCFIHWRLPAPGSKQVDHSMGNDKLHQCFTACICCRHYQRHTFISYIDRLLLWYNRLDPAVHHSNKN